METKKSSQKVKKVYSNIRQQQFLMLLHKIAVLVAGRGFGKSHGIGFYLLIIAKQLPGARGLLSCKTLKQFRSKTLPIIEKIWQGMELKEEIHYSFKKKRPAHFDDPIEEPKELDDVIWFCNGTFVEIVASTQYNNARGGSYDFVIADEAAFFPEEFFDDIIIPSIRGNVGRFIVKVSEFLESTGLSLEYLQSFYKRPIKLHQLIKNPLHHSVRILTSPPEDNKGYWVYKFEELAKTDPLEVIFLNGSAYDNKYAFGIKNIKMAKKIMKPRIFKREMLGHKVEEAEIKFYFKFDEDIHTFTPSPQYTVVADKLYVKDRFSQSINTGKPIHLSFDVSGWINLCTIWQPDGKYEVMHDAMHVKDDNSVSILVDQFCDRYESHEFKYAFIYGEPRGHDKTPFGKTIYQIIKEALQRRGWRVEIKVPRNKRTEFHEVRHTDVNDVLAETIAHYPIVKINKTNCVDVIKAINLCEANPDNTKNKARERDRNYPQQWAPHYTDTLDYYLLQKHPHIFRKQLDTSADYG